MAWLFIISAQERPPTPRSGFTWDDKVQHALAFAFLAFLTYHVGARLIREWTGRLPLYALAFVWASLYGLSDEWHQSFVPGRDASLWDFIADMTGAALAVAFIAIRAAWRNRRGRDAPAERPSRRVVD